MAGAVGVGYVLGRTRKMKLALALAGYGLARQDGIRELRERATSLAGSPAELSKITDSVRGELLDAARSAAITAAGHRIDALNARLQPHPDDTAEPGEDDDEDDTAEDVADEGSEDEVSADDAHTSDTGEPEKRPRRAPARRATSTTRRRTAEQPARTSTRSGERRSATARRSRAGAESRTADSAPVRRTRR
ncbi:hypothetical protein [Nocardia sp. NPDC003345]